MKVNFFIEECQTENILAPDFGICDSESGKAYVDLENREKWVARVRNRSGNPINFTSIDNCVEIRRETGESDFRCDGMLSGNGLLIFVELKDQRGDWIQHAVWDQLFRTINHFKESHPVEGYKKKFAYACNKRHPQFHSNKMDMMNEFRIKTGFRLLIVNEIVI